MTEEFQADARNVIDWYRRYAGDRLHDLAFASSALAESQAREAELRDQLGQIKAHLDGLQSAIDASDANRPPSLDDPEFGEWVAEHWEQIEDAKIAHAVSAAALEPVLVQP